MIITDLTDFFFYHNLLHLSITDTHEDTLFVFQFLRLHWLFVEA